MMSLFGLTLGGASSSSPTRAELLPKPPEVLADMRLANDYFMEKWPDPGADIVTNRSRPSNLWTRATYYEGLMALYAIDPQRRYYRYTEEWGEAHEWRPTYDRIHTADADHQCCGQTYIDMYRLDPLPERIEPIKACIDWVISRPDHAADWWWIDALQMAMPIYARLAEEYDDDAYYEAMYAMYTYTKTQHGENGLYNDEDNLWWRDEDFDPPYTSPNGEDCYWSRGNGWVLAALVRVLDEMPADAPHRDEYVSTFKEMAEALVKVQRDDGFWNVSLHDPNEFGGPETSGTAFFVYGFAWGISHGLLDRRAFLPAVTKGWKALAENALHRDTGFLGYVQGTGKEPADGQPVTYKKAPDFEDYGLGAFLLAGAEVYTLAENVHGSAGPAR